MNGVWRRIVLGAALAAAFLWMPALAGAALPDPVGFGVAVETGKIDRVRDWLDEGLDPNMLADRIGTGLMIGAWEGNIPMMALFLERGADINFTNDVGEQALQMAAWKGQRQAVEWLLDHGAGVNRKGRAWGALHYAVFAGHEEIVRLLMSRGSDVNARAPNGSSVLMMAAREGHETIATLLLEAGADPRVRNDWGDTALTWAMRQNNLRIARRIADPSEFAAAVKAPPESFGTAIRSIPPPAGIEEILKQIRQAQAQGKPIEPLRKALFDAIAAFKKDIPSGRKSPKPKVAYPRVPKAVVVTANRSGDGGERAEVVYDGTKKEGAGKTVEPTAPDSPAALLQRLRAAEAAGKPTAELRRAFMESVGRYRDVTP